MDKKTLLKFADLAINIGVNLQKNQGLEIICPTENSDVAEALTVKAYEKGASIVNIRWQNDKIDRLNYKYADKATLLDIPKWIINSKNYLIKKNFCYIAVDSENPNAFIDVPSETLTAYSQKKSKLLKNFSETVMSNGIRWCVVSVPTYEWSKLVFPKAENSEELLSKAIENSMRLNFENPIVEWEKHINLLEKRAKILNDYNFEFLHFKSKIGTDINIGLATNHIWLSAKEKAKDNIPFVANMPTEEVFTAPHIKKINGIVFSALPLSFNGNIIDRFFIKFKNGKIIDYGAEKGYDILKSIIETDKGTHTLGEVALIGKNSPIAKSKILFYNTLFDENASCHIALGKAYPTNVVNGAEKTKKQLKADGVNDSIEHVDFMIGTEDLSVTGIKYDKSEIKLFENGEWAI